MGDKNYFIDLHDPSGSRIRVSIKTASGQVVDLVIQLEIWFQDKWRPVARYDCAHGKAHVDLLSRDGSKEKVFLAAGNLKEVVERAISDFKENWEKYLIRCGYEEA